MKRRITPTLFAASLALLILLIPLDGRAEVTPLEFLKARELKHRDTKGEVYLGKVMALNYPPYGVYADLGYHPLLLELTDVLKSPLRRRYRIVLKGYSDSSGTAGENLRLSRERAGALKKLMIETYYMKGGRITAKGYGDAGPVASNETAEGRRLNRRVEIHIYGDVREAVRFIDRE